MACWGGGGETIENENKNDILLDESFKITFVGQSGVGKTCLIRRMVRGTWAEDDPTIGAVFSVKNIDLSGGEQLILHFWDVAGGDLYYHQNVYHRKAAMVIFVVDVTFRDSTRRLEYLEKAVFDVIDRTTKVVLVGTKIDLREEKKEKDLLGREEVNKWLSSHLKRKRGEEEEEEENLCPYFEVSSKDGSGIEELLDYMTLTFKPTGSLIKRARAT